MDFIRDAVHMRRGLSSLSSFPALSPLFSSLSLLLASHSIQIVLRSALVMASFPISSPPSHPRIPRDRVCGTLAFRRRCRRLPQTAADCHRWATAAPASSPPPVLVPLHSTSTPPFLPPSAPLRPLRLIRPSIHPLALGSVASATTF